MSAVPEPHPGGGVPPPLAPAATEPPLVLVPRAAKLYLALLVAAAAAAASAVYLRGPLSARDWPTFAALAAAATIAQAFPVKTPRNMLYHTSVVFLVAAALLLPPELLVLIPLVQTVPEWLKERYPWSMQSFNVANYILDGVAAWAVADLIDVHGTGMVASANVRFALAGLAACITFVAVNHVLVAGVLRMERDHGFLDSGLFSLESVSVDLVLAMLGVSLAAFWRWNPWLVFAALAPLVVVHRSLSVPQLRAEARVDPKTGLYNARYFATALATELARAARFERPMTVIMADLDLLRDLNNSHGHLAGDAVLRGIADVFRSELRHYDVPARFGGEEFSILLPETTTEEALEIAERIRRAVAEREFHVATTPESLRATVSIGVAGFPEDGVDANELVHQADLAVYRAKLQGRNRVLGAASEPLVPAPAHRLPSAPALAARLHAVPAAAPPADSDPAAPATEGEPAESLEERFPALGPLAFLAGVVAALGVCAGAAGLFWGGSSDAIGLLATTALVGGGQALSFELADVAGSISVSVVGSLAGAALFGYRAALPLAVATAVVGWAARRTALRKVLYDIGALSLASIGAAGVFSLGEAAGATGTVAYAVLGVVAGCLYFGVTMALLSVASGLEAAESPWYVFRARCGWLLPHYVVYGFVGGVIAVAYHAVGLWALAVFAVPLLLLRKTQEAYLSHTQRATQKLREAADTIRAQNVSLEHANRLLRERSTAAMESLSATVDARDSYTAGHSRRVQQLALSLGQELGLSQAELDLLGRAALFHDIGKLAVPDAILLKPGSLSGEEWELMQRHAEEGARIIDRLGFLQDAVPAIRHHHERYDGDGYPDGLAGEEIPLGARIIHVADALDSMLTTRIYRAARPLEDSLAEIRDAAGTQFCPRCVAALERLLPLEAPVLPPSALVEAS